VPSEVGRMEGGDPPQIFLFCDLEMAYVGEF